MLLPLGALELSDKVQTYGAYAGFASVLGLAVLSLLYFGQARELRRLREWAGRAPERAAELQERVQAEASAAADAGKRVVAQPAARPAAATSVAQAAQAAAAKQGTAAPAVPAIPAANPGAPGALSVPPSTAAGATAAAAAGAPSGGVQAPTADKPADGATPGAPVDQPTVVQGGLGRPTQPTTAAAAAPAPAKPSSPPPTGGGTGELVLPHPHPTAAAAGSTQESGETAVPLRRVSAGVTLPPRAGVGGGPGGGAPSDDGRGSGGGRGPFAIIAGIAAVLIVGAIVATQLIGGDDEPTQPNAITTAAAVDPAAQDRPRETTNTTEEPEVARGSVSVAVLNGTTITGLASGAAKKIEATGYTIASVGDNSVQTIQTSSVQFADGSRRAAEDVAKIVGIPVSALAPLEAGTRVVAGEDAAVVVIVGADKSQ